MSLYYVLILATLDGLVLPSSRIVLTLFALELGAQPFTAGLLFASFSLGPMLLSFPAGKISDRFGPRWLLTFTALGGGCGLLMPFLFPGIPAIFIAALLIGSSEGIYSVALQSLVGQMSSERNRATNFSNFVLSRTVGTIVGPLIAGFSIDLVGHGVACTLLAALTLGPTAMLLVRGHMLPRGHHKAAHAGGGVRGILGDPYLRRALATSSLLHVGKDLYQFYMPVYTHAIGLSASATGIIIATNSAATFVVRLIMPFLVRRFKEEKLLVAVFCIGAVSLMLVPLFENAVMLTVISFVFGLGMGCGGPIVLMLMFSGSPEGRSGETLGLRMTVNHMTKLIGPVAFGFLASVAGLFATFWLNAFMMGTGGVLARPRRR